MVRRTFFAMGAAALMLLVGATVLPAEDAPGHARDAMETYVFDGVDPDDGATVDPLEDYIGLRANNEHTFFGGAKAIQNGRDDGSIDPSRLLLAK
jgi:hypothetical protein